MPDSDGSSRGAQHGLLARRARTWALLALRSLACREGSSTDAGGTPGNAPHGSGADGGAGSDDGTAGRAGDTAARAGAGGTRDAEASGGQGADGSSAADGAGHLPYEPPEPASAALPARVFKLSHAEYARSVAALLEKPVTELELELEPELDNGVYPHFSSSGLVRDGLARDYYAEAKRVALSLGTEELARLIPGGELAPEAKAAFVEKLVTRAFRRPATDAERATYEELFELAVSAGSLELGFRSVLRALLTAPAFLYRSELGSDASAGEFSLTDHEVASLLSFGLLGEPPPAALLERAERGELTSLETLGDAVRELVRTPAAARSLAAFAGEWLKLERFQPEPRAGLPPQPEKDHVLAAGFDAVRAAMLEEATAFLAENAGPGATLRALLTAEVPLGDASLRAFYASEPSADGPGVRTGVLALGSLLSVYASEAASSPTRRGHFVRERLLCQELSLPAAQPPALEATLERAEPATTRELYEQHARAPACAGCHALLDDVGFAFEGFDAVGRARTSERGTPIDTRFVLSNTDVDGSYTGHAELASALAESEWVRECVAIQAFRRYFGELEPARGVPPVEAARRALADGTFADALGALFTTESTYRRRRE
jgi:hypothetical protein